MFLFITDLYLENRVGGIDLLNQESNEILNLAYYVGKNGYSKFRPS